MSKSKVEANKKKLTSKEEIAKLRDEFHEFRESIKNSNPSIKKGFLKYFDSTSLKDFVIPLIVLFITAWQTWVVQSQKDIMDIQNTMLEKQNKRIDQQTKLQQSEKYSSLNFLLSSLFEKINEELGDNGNLNRKISHEAIINTATCANSFRTYNIIEGDSISKNEYSLERGTLLFYLLKNNIDTMSMDSIISMSDFNGAYLKSNRLMQAYLKGAYLKNANMVNCWLQNSNLSYSNLDGVNFEKAILDNANLTNASIQGANLFGAKGLTVNNLKEASSLYGTIGIPDSIITELKKIKPELFEKPK